ncbi:Phosphoenolpyruvate-protein phosphotransferase, partial [Nocardioides sp. PD653-B2]
GPGRRHARRLGGLVRAPDRGRVHGPDRPDVLHRVLRPDPGRARLRGRRLREGRAPARVGRTVRPDRCGHRPGPPGDRVDPGGAALRGRQFLRQRQAHRCGRRTAALRRRPRVRHQRQGRRSGQPAALDLTAVDQGDVRATEGLPLPLHGV